MKESPEALRERKRRQREKLRNLVLLLFPKDCFRCHRFGLEMEFAHLKPTGLRGRQRGSVEALRDVLQNRESYARLCWECHRGIDSGKLPLELEEAPF